jgi:hypothetical protein
MLFRRKPAPPAPSNFPPERIAEVLLQLFRAHGVEAAIGEAWTKRDLGSASGGSRLPLSGVLVHLPANQKVTAAVALVNPIPNGVSVQLDVYFSTAEERLIIESLVGVGPSLDAAIGDALQAFATNLLHVLLAAFFEFPTSHVSQETWSVSGIERPVTIGGAAIRGKAPDADLPLEECLAQIRRAFESRSATPQAHWIRVYVALTKGKAQTIEVLLDNMAWAAGGNAIAALDWPDAEQFYSVRFFLIIHKVPIA